MYLRDTGWEFVDWINLTQVRDNQLAGYFEYVSEPLGSLHVGNFLTN